MKSNRLFILGIDGATFDLLDPWIEQGKLPNFAHIINKGCRGNLTSTIPSVSCLAWPSLVTGTNPGKHGIFDWLEVTEDKKAEAMPVSSRDRRAPALWDLLSAEGRRVGVLNVPITYPPDKVNGFMVSGMDSPRNGQVYTYPSELAEKLNAVCGPYMVDVYNFENIQDLECHFQLVDKMMVSRKKTLFHLLDQSTWDFFIAVFVFADRLQHRFWSLWDSTHPFYNPELAHRYGHKLLEYYQQVDEILGELLHRFKDEVNLLVVSDHGFGPIRKVFSVNNFLRRIGVLQIDPPTHYTEKPVKESWTLRMGKSMREFAGTKMGKPWKDFLRARMGKTLQEFIDNTVPLYSNRAINFSQTRAYTLSPTGNIHINLKGKHCQGMVEAGKEYEDLRNYIIEELRRLEDPDTGEPVIGEIYKKEELYWGEHLVQAPDIIFLTRDQKYFIVESYSMLDDDNDYRIIKPVTQKLGGDHRMNGILIAYGPDIAEGGQLEGAHITDVAPTTLHLLSSPVLREMDGKILASLLKKEFQRQHPVVYREKPAQPVSTTAGKPVYSPQEAEEIRQRLKGMGYLS